MNGFYRLTRGTFALFGLPVPHPQAAIDTVLAHTRCNDDFVTRNVNACNCLDVIHALWLCQRQTDYRRADVQRVLSRQIGLISGRWVDGEGFGFAAGDPPSLRGTEMWLAAIHTAAAALGHESELDFAPRGVHRLRHAAAAATAQTAAPDG